MYFMIQSFLIYFLPFRIWIVKKSLVVPDDTVVPVLGFKLVWWVDIALVGLVGLGLGPGPGCGPGAGWGLGPGAGWGLGPGAGWGLGPGAGWGFGPGAGWGWGCGPGPGAGLGLIWFWAMLTASKAINNTKIVITFFILYLNNYSSLF